MTLTGDRPQQGAPAPDRPRSRIRALPAVLHGGDPLLRTGQLLTISALLTSVLGAAYWGLSSRLFTPATVGRNYSAVSALTFLAGVGALNLSDVLMRFVPAAGRRTRLLVLRAYGAATLLSLLIATCFVLLVPAVSPGLLFLHTPLTGVAFVAGTAGYTVFILQDGALTGLRRPGAVIVENALFAAAKIGFVIALGVVGLMAGILVSWLLALIVALAATNCYLLARALPRHMALPPPGGGAAVRPTVGYVAADYAGSLCWLAATTLPPILVLDLLGPTRSAYFSLTWLTAQTLYLVSINMGSSLVVESARRPEGLAGFGHAFRHTGFLLLGLVTVLAAGAPQILRVFGPDYARSGSSLLRVLAVSALPHIVIVVAVSVARARRRMTLVVVVFAALAVLVLALTLLLVPLLGLFGAGVAWLATETSVAVVLLLCRSTWLPPRDPVACAAPALDAVETVEPLAEPLAEPPLVAPAADSPADRPEGPADGPDGGSDEPAAAPPMPADLSVVVCGYTTDRADDLRAAMASLHAQRCPAREIVLVVDHSAELAAWARRELRGVRVVESRNRQGLAGARNTGIAEASGSHIAFLDDDATADPDWTTHLTAAYAHPDVLGVGGHIEPRWDGERPRWWPAEFDWVIGCTYVGMPEGRRPVRNFIGANMSFRRDVLLGRGFAEDLGRVGTRPLGCEETELCIRVVGEHGGVLVHEPRAAVRHRVRAPRATWAYFRSRCYAEGLSKAAMTRHTGARSALASERSYLRVTIPLALLRTLRPGRAPGRFGRALALLTGVTWTAAGYLAGRLSRPAFADATAATAPAGSAGTLDAGVAGHGGGLLAGAALPDEPDEADAARRPRLAAVATLATRLCLPGAIALWGASLGAVHLRSMNDLGLVAVLPVTYWVGLGLLLAGFVTSVMRRHTAGGWRAGYVLGLIAMLHATPAVLYPTLRYAWAWKHVAVTGYLLQHAHVAPGGGTLSAYSEWPGFFALNAFLIKLSGVHSALSYAAWGPVFFNTAMLAPLLLLFRSVTRDRRLVWCGAWLFYSASWVGQDYFSPQAFALLLHLSLLAIVVPWLTRRAAAPEGSRERLPRGDLALALVIAAGIATSHQLTPIMLIVALAAFTVGRRHRRAMLPLLCGTTAIVVGWDATIARPFLSGNATSIFGSLGDVDANTSGGFAGLTAASHGQVVIAYLDRVGSALLCLLALVALIRRPGLRRAPLALLAVAPIPLLASDSYGGEIVLRVYLFMLPALACCAAVLLLRGRRGLPGVAPAPRWYGGRPLAAVAAPTAMAVVLTGTVFGYYGKERANWFTSGEVRAARAMYAAAPHGSLILSPNDDFPDAYRDYPDYVREWFAEETPAESRELARHPATTLARLTRGMPPDRAFVLISRAQQAESDLDGSPSPGTLDRVRRTLATSHLYTLVYRDRDAVVYRFNGVVTPLGGTT